MAPNEHSLHTCPAEDELRRYHARELPAERAAAVRDHLESCSACAATSARLLDEHNAWVERVRCARQVLTRAVRLAPPQEPALAADDVPGYEILGEIRRGGQGIVFRALQRSTKREVALKVLREGCHASETTRRRFQREIELAAGLRHPHIVTVFDSGTTRDGRLYFAMDYVRGRSLDRFVADRGLPWRDRLALFVQICRAVNFAHQRGVIHRDLKPSNVLVDEDGEPHVLDFGLARPAVANGEAAMTATGQVAGTLPYMSPEQARGLPDAIDVRSDVYSLGVMLYELLAGEYPYPVEGDTIRVLRHIAETPPALIDRIGTDLGTIVFKALAKEREERYQTAGELAADLERHLAGEPIEARRGSGWYVLRKTLYRYRVASAVGAAFLLIIVAGLAVSLTFWRQAATERDAARAARTVAEQQSREAKRQAELARAAEARARKRFGQVRDLAHVFIYQLDPKLATLPGSAPLRRFIVEKGLKYLDALAAEASDDLRFQGDLAGAYVTIGDVQGDLITSNLGELDNALASYRKAIDILDGVRAVEPQAVGPRRTALLAWLKIGDTLDSLGRTEEMRDAYRQALALGEQLAAEVPADAFVRDQLAAAHSRMSWALQTGGDLPGALEHIRRAMRLHEKALAGDPDDPWLAQRLAANYSRLGQLQLAQGLPDQALASQRRFLELSERFVAAMPQHSYGRRCVAIAHQWIGITQADRGDHAAALASYERALAALRALHKDDPANDLVRTDIAETLIRASESRVAAGRPAAARTDLLAALEALDPLVRTGSTHADVLRLRGAACRALGKLEVQRAAEADSTARARDHWQAARAWFERARAIFDEMRKRKIVAPADAETGTELAERIRQCEAAMTSERAPE